MQRASVIVAGVGFAGLLALGIHAALAGSGLLLDVALSTAALVLFTLFARRLHQDAWSHGALVVMLLLHCLGLYGTHPLGVPFDHYMHFVGGAALALIADRLWNERLSPASALLVVLVALGVGAIGEIIEWLGYAYLAPGEGFLRYGVGDEGEWRNAVLDMVFNGFGASVLALALAFGRARNARSRRRKI